VIVAAVVVAVGLLVSVDGSSSPGGETPGAPLATSDGDPPPTEPAAPSASDEASAPQPVDPETTDGTVEEVAEDPPPAATAGRGTLTLQHVGDVQLDPDAHPSLGRLGAAVWDDVRELFSRGDLVLANLECAATTRDDPQPKQYVFRCDLEQLPGMREAGVTAVTVANNHSGDHGIPGIVDSLRNAEAAGLVAIGAGADDAEAYAARIVELQGWRVALLGFGGVVPDPDWTARGDRPGQASGYDAVAMARAVEAAGDVADLVVVSIHWGEEGSFEPREEDRERAEAVIAAGADVVFGHHAHRLQPLERVRGVPVFWNLGNFLWPRTSDDAAITAVAELVVAPDGTVDACLLPVEIDQEGRPVPTGAAPTCR
jgi:hypothetical protein